MNIDYFIYQPPYRKRGRNMFFNYPVPHYTVGKGDLHIFYHGNATDALISLNNDVRNKQGKYMYIEYPGYGNHPNDEVSTSVILTEVSLLAEWIIKGKYNVHIVGQSIGTGPACYLAYLLHTSGLIKDVELVTPFSNMNRLATDYTYLLGYFVWNCYPNDKYLEEIIKAGYVTRDKIIIHHGTNDQIISYNHAKTLSCYGTLKTYKGATHNNIPWKTISR